MADYFMIYSGEVGSMSYPLPASSDLEAKQLFKDAIKRGACPVRLDKKSEGKTSCLMEHVDMTKEVEAITGR